MRRRVPSVRTDNRGTHRGSLFLEWINSQGTGCLRRELNQRVEDPGWITFFEKWKDREVFDTHCATSYIKHYFGVVRQQLVEEVEVNLDEAILP